MIIWGDQTFEIKSGKPSMNSGMNMALMEKMSSGDDINSSKRDDYKHGDIRVVFDQNIIAEVGKVNDR